ncbi:alpha-amylase family glycosyl hydrolase [Saccharophagus degradans]|uniref:Alpha-amylase family glycosyl hydrolase n=1 Tax=Saccharophagus degradans TaxID=86304 RepID=A0AAW7X701_9GAMM|nr:alpha-amylase family glycosyl hydrolase [Saccharophagus degradans]MDO6422164.1 alpha-amylase family glycosyl hydrolase [Saccharophagus degradans]MDO6607561.1 alpha-amylase family glycosyl hydrolase [Saccharophagus degradans]
MRTQNATITRLILFLSLSLAISACNGNGPKQNTISEQTPPTDQTPAQPDDTAGADTEGTEEPEETPDTENNSTTVRIHYLNSNQAYDNWGLHLWGDAIASSTATNWTSPFALTRAENDYGLYEVPLADPNGTFNFIMHFGDFKNPAYDFSIIPAQFGTDIWLVQDTPADVNNGVAIPFDNEADARAAYESLMANIGNASAALDLSDVAIKDSDTGLAADWVDTAHFAEIYIRGYQDSDGNGIGDIQGLISRLDYLAESGINGIWLMPAMESSDNDHGYATSDYRAIESDYGTMQDFQQLLDEAHARNIAIVMDYVMNHSSNANPLFQDALSSPTNSKRDWYIIRDEKLEGWNTWGSDPWKSNPNGYYYAAFSSHMPDFNLRNPDVIRFHQNNLRFWLNMGVDGFRFDAVGVLVENGKDAWEDQDDNHPVINAMKTTIEAYQKRYIVCESPTGYAAFAQQNSCGRAFNFSAGHGILRSVKQGKLDAEFVEQLNASNIDAMPLILANHDAFAGIRVWDQLNGNKTQYKLAAASYLLASRNPFTYYGEEIGLAGAANLSGDWSIRTPMSWNNDPQNAGFSTTQPFRELSSNAMTQNVEAQLGKTDSLLAYYRSIYDLRNAHPVIANGNLIVQGQANDNALVLVRTSDDAQAVILFNYSAQAASKSVSGLTASASYSGALGASNNVSANASGTATITIPAQTAVVYIRQ